MGTPAYSQLIGHYYEIVNNPTTWNTALTTAAQQTYRGLYGYLATITSVSEQTFAFNYVSASQSPTSLVWLGASDQDIEGDWIWVSGPENGLLFWRGNGSTGSAVSGAYTNWDINASPPNRTQIKVRRLRTI